MSKYELNIECKACREGDHHNCSGGKKGFDNIVQIRCSCSFCKKWGMDKVNGRKCN
jgi:hypothetical protein